MSFYNKISLAVKKYEESKSSFTRLFRLHPAIKALKKLDFNPNSSNRATEFEILWCFFKEMPNNDPTRKSYNVFQTVIKSLFNNPSETAREKIPTTLNILHQAELLSEANFYAMKECTILTSFCEVVDRLNDAHLLTQENFNRLASPLNEALLHPGIVNRVWQRIPPHLLTQAVLDQLIELAQQEEPYEQIAFYANQLTIDERAQQHRNGLENNNPFNNNQSTHTESVHASVSNSAKKLWERYKSELSGSGLEDILTKIKKKVSKLPNDGRENEAAKECIERLTKSDYNYFTDRASGITIKQLLALSYLARNDDKNRFGSLKDANKQFIHGLYEIQRGYNLSANGVDDGEADKPICTAGTFNKLIEKLNAIHVDVELIFMSKETASSKLPIVVKEEVKNYLALRLSKAEDNKEFDSFIKLIDGLEKEGIEVIWQEIKSQVADRLFDEFKSLYGNNKEDVGFKGLVAGGEYAELGSLVANYRQKLESSSIYRECCRQTKKQGHFGFFHSEITESSIVPFQPAHSSLLKP